MKFSNIRIQWKVLGCIGLLAVVAGAALWFSASMMRQIDDVYAELIENDAEALKNLIRSNVRVASMDGVLEKHILAPTSEEKRAVEGQIADTVKEFFELNDKAAKHAESEQKSEITAVRSSFEALMVDVEKIKSASMSQNHELTQSLMLTIDRQLSELRKQNSAITDQIEKIMMDNVQAASENTTRTIAITVSAVVAALLFVLGLSFAITKYGIVRPLTHLAALMQQLAKGDFSVSVDGVERKDEVGLMARSVEVFKRNGLEAIAFRQQQEEEKAKAEAERKRSEAAAIAAEREMVSSSIGAGILRLAEKDLTYRITEALPEAYAKLQADFNSAMDQIEGVIRSVSDSTQVINTGTLEISSASDDLSRRTESQAASLEQTAAAVTEITGKVRQAAEGAAIARTVVASAREEAAKSGEVVKRAIESMSGIEKSSQQITQIIGVIDEIAFQTNLLALNAGVEAARAGDAGKGFAVVAQEVRALAQRSAEAAKEIKTLIVKAQSEVGQGVVFVSETGASLERIVLRVGEINKVVNDIAAAAEEQASGLAQVNTAVDQIDQTTQQNAAMVEEATAATKNLAKQSDDLNGVISSFVISARQVLKKAHGGGTAAAVPHTPAPMAAQRRAAGGKSAAARNADEGWTEF